MEDKEMKEMEKFLKDKVDLMHMAKDYCDRFNKSENYTIDFIKDSAMVSKDTAELFLDLYYKKEE